MTTPHIYFPLCLTAILIFSSGCTTIPARALVVSETMTAHLPDGTVVHPVIIVPTENISQKNAAYQDWEASWPRKYRFYSH